MFDGQYYNQINGVAMGSPLGPVWANIFMCDFEENWVVNNGARPTTWFRYADDTFTLFHNKNTAVQFLLISILSIAGTRTFNSSLSSNRTRRFLFLMFSSNANLTTLFPLPSTERKRSLDFTLNGTLLHLGNTKLTSSAHLLIVVWESVYHPVCYSLL